MCSALVRQWSLLFFRVCASEFPPRLVIESSQVVTATNHSEISMMSSPSSIDDNPCWGGQEPSSHNLEYLLQVLGKSTQSIETMDDRTSHNNTSSKCKQQINEDNYSAFIQRIHEKLILYQDENYIAIHKPPDLRMDGPHLATVHKLLLYLFPPLSLRKLISNEDTDACDLKNKNDGVAIEKARDGPGNSGVSEKCNNHNSEGNSHTTDENKTTSNYYSHRRLLQCIHPLSTHSSLKDDPFRIVHQLDYATSGVLLLARNKHAAGVACRSFMERKTNKKYLAVITLPINATLDGTTDPLPPLGPEFFQKLPILPSSALSQWENGSLEQKYRKKRRREAETREGKKGTFNGFMPVHAVFAKWRAVLLREKKEAERHSKKASVNDAGVQQRDISMQEQCSEEISAKRKHANWKQQPKTDILPPLPKPKTELTTEEIDEMLLIGPSWKAVKTHCASNNKRSKCWITMLEAMAKEYNQSLEEYYSKKNEIEEAEEAMEQEKNRNENATGCSDNFNMGTLPPLFRLQEEEGGVGKNANEKVADNTSTFYICASIGEPDDGRFTVVVDPVAAFSSSGYKDNVGTTTSLDMKPSLTKCTVLWKGYLDARSDNYALVDDSTSRIPVAKVLLEPRTGRRHQLRIHMAQICGCPILGDVAYGGNIVEMNTSNDNGDNLFGYLRGLSCNRMCLHAKQLAIPLIGGENKTLSAPDPFPIVEQCVSIS